MYSQPTPSGKIPGDPTPAKLSRSTLVSRNITIAGHRTSVRLEPDMWSGLGDICNRERATLHEICTAVAQQKDEDTSLTAAIRVFVMSYYRAASTEDGHSRAGHGNGVAVLIVTMAPPHRLRIPPMQITPDAVTMPMQNAPQALGTPQVTGYAMGARDGDIR